jgi:NAD-dependent SIR2 family protein deacetylase
MKEAPCTQCGLNYDEDELIKREDNGELVCPDCSGLLTDEDLGCRYDETG